MANFTIEVRRHSNDELVYAVKIQDATREEAEDVQAGMVDRNKPDVYLVFRED